MTIYEVLLNAHHNLCEGTLGIQHEIGKSQLDNVVELLEQRKTLEDEFDDTQETDV